MTTKLEYTPRQQINLEICLFEYCFSGQLSEVQRLFATPFSAFILKHSERLDKALELAVEGRHLDITQYLIEKAPISRYDLSQPHCEAFIISCEQRNTAIMRYFLNSPLLSIDIASNNKAALTRAIHNANIEGLRYLLTSAELTTPCQMSTSIFLEACSTSEPHLLALRYFLFEYGIDTRDKAIDLYFEREEFAHKTQAWALVCTQREKSFFEQEIHCVKEGVIELPFIATSQALEPSSLPNKVVPQLVYPKIMKI